MGFFGMFKKKEVSSMPKGFHAIRIKDKVKLTSESVKLVFDIPSDLKSVFKFIPGQYVNLAAQLNKQDIRRSYSICSGAHEDLAVGVKRAEKGIFSNYALNDLAVGDEIWVSAPMGNFKWVDNVSKIVAFAAGSGITPILSIAKSAEEKGQTMKLFYGNRTFESTMFQDELEALKDVEVVHYFTRESRENAFEGRLSKAVSEGIFDNNPELLTADAYYLCGPQDMVENIQSALLSKGVTKEKIYFELFEVKQDESIEIAPKTEFKGKSTVTVICDQEESTFEMTAQSNILQKALDNDVDAPYSCRGGVCCTCKCKVIEGSAEMRLNYTLTDAEISEGYILSCQAYPTSEKIVVTYDE